MSLWRTPENTEQLLNSKVETLMKLESKTSLQLNKTNTMIVWRLALQKTNTSLEKD